VAAFFAGIASLAQARVRYSPSNPQDQESVARIWAEDFLQGRRLSDDVQTVGLIQQVFGVLRRRCKEFPSYAEFAEAYRLEKPDVRPLALPEPKRDGPSEGYRKFKELVREIKTKGG